MPMLGSCQHRDMTCSWHARMPIRRLMLLACLSAEGSVPSDVLAGFKRAESASTNCICTFNAIECRTHVKPSLPLRGTCWLPWHCRCPIMVSAYLSKTVRSIAWVWFCVFVTSFYYGFSHVAVATPSNLAENLACVNAAGPASGTPRVL